MLKAYQSAIDTEDCKECNKKSKCFCENRLWFFAELKFWEDKEYLTLFRDVDEVIALVMSQVEEETA